MASTEQINQPIIVIRGYKVMLSIHLADLYGVEARALVQAVKRNKERFPEDFMFQLKHGEVEFLRSQNVILEKRYNTQFKVVFDSIRELINAKPT